MVPRGSSLFYLLSTGGRYLFCFMFIKTLSGCIDVCAWCLCRGQKRAWDPPELEVFVSHHVGIEPRSYVKTTSALKCWATSPAHLLVRENIWPRKMRTVCGPPTLPSFSVSQKESASEILRWKGSHVSDARNLQFQGYCFISILAETGTRSNSASVSPSVNTSFFGRGMSGAYGGGQQCSAVAKNTVPCCYF